MTRRFAGIAILVASSLAFARVGDRPAELEPQSDADLARETAVESGLAWLAAHQGPSGAWTGATGHKQQDDYVLFETERAQAERDTGHVGVTSLAGLAFLASGHVPGRGPYGAVLDRALDFVLSRRTEFGYVTNGEERMYSHAFAALFLAQVRGMTRTRSAEVDDALRAAVSYLQDSQNPAGGWRYVPFSKECDLSVTVCQVQALRAARASGIHVDRSCIDRVIQYIRNSRIDGGEYDGCFYYKITGRAAYSKTSFAINAAAVTALHSAGVYDAREYGPAITFLETEYPSIQRDYPTHFYFWYGNYYATQALHMESGPRFDRWFARIDSDLRRRQRQDGSWENDVGPGDAFATAVACLILRIPDEILPIFQT